MTCEEKKKNKHFKIKKQKKKVGRIPLSKFNKGVFYKKNQDVKYKSTTDSQCYLYLIFTDIFFILQHSRHEFD